MRSAPIATKVTAIWIPSIRIIRRRVADSSQSVVQIGRRSDSGRKTGGSAYPRPEGLKALARLNAGDLGIYPHGK